MNDRLYRFSSIGRPIDPSYPTNRAIAALSLGLGAVVFLVRLLGGATPPAALLGGVVFAATFFLAWAIAREIDPDQPLAAFVAAGLSLLPLWLYGRPSFAALFLILLAFRILNRTVGPAARLPDTLMLLGVAALVAWQGHPAVVGMATVALLLDGLLEPPHRAHIAAAGAGLALIGVGLSRLAPSAGPSATAWIALLAMIPFALVVRRSARPDSVSDVGQVHLSGTRVRAVQLLAVAGLAVAVFVEGMPGLVAVSGVWAAVVGTGIHAVFAGGRGRS
jgi:hypothetical protein